MNQDMFKWLLLIALILGASLAFANREKVREYFEDALTSEEALMEEQIVQTYLDVLARQPSSAELIRNSRDIKSGKLTLKGLKQKLMDTDEYVRGMKTQSNKLAPELDKMLADQTILNTISSVYKEERRDLIPSVLVLPWRDIYTIALDYNEYTLRAWMRDQGYPQFEKDMKRTAPNMTRDEVIAAFKKAFNLTDLIAAGVEIRKADEAKKGPVGAEGAAARCIPEPDTDMSRMIAAIMKDSEGIFDKDSVAATLDAIQKIENDPNMTPEEKKAAIKAILAMANQEAMSKAISANGPLTDSEESLIIPMTHEGDMVLRPEFAWSVPQRRAPVCNTLGQRPLVQPLLESSKLLLGTPLDSATRNTQVGSVMPKFVHQQYAEVPVPKK